MSCDKFSRSETELITSAVRTRAPTATAGEAGIPWHATRPMTARQLQDQCAKLAGRVVVYGIRQNPSSLGDAVGDFQHYAGTLKSPKAERADGEHWVQASVTHNNIVGIVPCETEDEEYSLPTVGYEYNFVVDGLVYQTRAAEAATKKLMQKIAVLEQHLETVLAAQRACQPSTPPSPSLKPGLQRAFNPQPQTPPSSPLSSPHPPSHLQPGKRPVLGYDVKLHPKSDTLARVTSSDMDGRKIITHSLPRMGSFGRRHIEDQYKKELCSGAYWPKLGRCAALRRIRRIIVLLARFHVVA